MFFSLALCLFVVIFILSFPASFPRKDLKTGIKKIQLIFLTSIAYICIVLVIINNRLSIPEIYISIKIALLLIPAISCSIFSFFLYYPSIRFLVLSNIKDKKIIDALLVCLFRCAYSDTKGSKVALTELSDFYDKENAFVVQYGLSVYLDEYVNQAKDTPTYKPSITIIQCVFDRCSQVKHDIDIYTPVPYPNIGLVLSFMFSTFLTILIAIITAASG